jgi:hypothetical protein
VWRFLFPFYPALRTRLHSTVPTGVCVIAERIDPIECLCYPKLDLRNPENANVGLRPTNPNLRIVFVKLPQTRHPERSASQFDRVTQRLWRGAEGPRGCSLTHAVRSFSTTEPHRAGPPRSLPGKSELWLQAPSSTVKARTIFARPIPSSKTLRRLGDGR